MQKYIIALLLLIFSVTQLVATHLKGGEITVKRISDKTLTYEFTLTTFTESNAANEQQDDVNFCFGDGSGIFKAKRCCGTPLNLGNGTLKNIYKIEYTYPAPSLVYRVSVAIPNRNEGVRNISRSIDVAFYVETNFSINSGLGLNSTPLLLNPAVDLTAIVGQKFIHNANAVDAEGDSLAYRLSVSKTGDSETCSSVNRGVPAPNFRQPNEVSALASSFDINALTGDLVWNTPQEVGIYNCAFIIEEWRNGVKISETVRDMQIEVKDADNRAPKIIVPADVCVIAGATLSQTISAEDVASRSGRLDPLTISSTGNVYANVDPLYAVLQPFASFNSTPRQVSPARATFNWQTACQHIRKEPYDVLFKVEDNPPTAIGNTIRLVDSKIWKIRVLAPVIQGLKAETSSSSVTLSWSPYTCSLPNTEIIIYRKSGACTPVVNKPCATGMTLAGYAQIGRVKVSELSFEDTSLQKNTNYSYVLVVAFTNSKGLEDYSPMSAGVCAIIATSAPVITQVSVLKTSKEVGEISIKWSNPINLDTVLFPKPYQYQLKRAEGISAISYNPIGARLLDTVFVDKGLNTLEKGYRYQVDVYFLNKNKQWELLESPAPASSVRLQAASVGKTIKLNWEANVPWSNAFQVHRIYRDRGKGIFNQINEISVADASTFQYIDSGVDFVSSDGKFDTQILEDSTYTYYIETVGDYVRPAWAKGLVNASQIQSVKSVKSVTPPIGEVNPCPPVLKLASNPCDATAGDCNPTFLINSLSWTPTVSNLCDPEIDFYRVYFSKTSDGKFDLLGQKEDLTFLHSQANTFVGCYQVTAVNLNGKESAKSNTVCQDNCPAFDLPNLFSPNGDKKNDSFLPMRCPRFVKQITCTIVDRFGQTVYNYTGDLAGFGWNGKGLQGRDVPMGSYFYVCEVDFDVVDESKKSKKLKGWLELVR
jgi:gliding motility-associated-like protein